MNFDDIRAYNNSEVPQTLERLVNEKSFMKLLSTVFPLLPKDVLKQQLLSVKTTEEFQRAFAYPYLKYLEETKTKGIDFYGFDKIDRNKSYLFISNHRDIILDSALLCLEMLEHNLDTVGIAIGDNLMIYPWIEDFVRMNKGFIVKRGLVQRQALDASQELSSYIRHLIQNEHRSVWIAQREGRAKDSNDRTQDALLRMLSMSGERDFLKNFSELNICPLSISYEYDPTDFLKAKEYQQKRDNPDFKKTSEDDLTHMQTGGLGYKGKVDYRISGDITPDLKQIESSAGSFREQISMLAKAIDRIIHMNYTIFPVNKIAYDLLKREQRFSSDYSDTERSEFEQYISRQIAKIDLEDKDSAFLRIKMLEMYANPLINKLDNDIEKI